VSKLVDLTSRARYMPDVVGLACGKVTTARVQLGLSYEEFAAALSHLLNWEPSADLIRSWERMTAPPPGDVVAACDVLSPPDPMQQQSTQSDFVDDGARWSNEPEQAVARLDALTGADMADYPEIVQASWASETAPSVITGYLFSSPTWPRDEEPLVAATNIAAVRIRAVAQHLMNLDFQYGGGYSTYAGCCWSTFNPRSRRCCESRTRDLSAERSLPLRPRWRSSLAGVPMTRAGTGRLSGISCRVCAWRGKRRMSCSAGGCCRTSVTRPTTSVGTARRSSSREQRRQASGTRRHRL